MRLCEYICANMTCRRWPRRRGATWRGATRPSVTRHGTARPRTARHPRRGETTLRGQPVGAAVQERDLAHLVLDEQLHEQPREAEAEAAVGRAAVAEEVQVVLDRAGVQPLFLSLRDELRVAVLSLRARRQLDP